MSSSDKKMYYTENRRLSLGNKGYASDGTIKTNTSKVFIIPDGVTLVKWVESATTSTGKRHAPLGGTQYVLGRTTLNEVTGTTTGNTILYAHYDEVKR